ncbi:hypothetical protein Aple_058280 [Acrocarpospora pleiomorpha]|uniref:DDE Tnp4 domain-containing protein n=1 Tax=Acrocarpospora pleiomorpha TaxID=90975 RepID=A0A5M3XSI3_9ACTN|nr:hypothetical protein Aple_058280 [Acrocarpospora pleiomorpha]
MQVIAVPDGWPIWTSQVRPGREHDTTAVGVHTEILSALAAAAGDPRSLGDLGYEGESQTTTVAFKTPQAWKAHHDAGAVQQGPNGLRAIGGRGNSLLKMAFRALRNVSLDPWRIGVIVAAAPVFLHFDHAPRHDGAQ